METYLDILTGDPFLSDKFPHQEVLPGMLWEVKGKWTVIKSHADNCTCPFESYEAYDSIGCGDDLPEIDIVWEYNLEAIGGYSKREFLFEFFVRVADALTGEAKVKFVKGFGQALTYIRSKSSANLQCYSGVTGQGGLIFVYHHPDPTFIYFVHNLVKSSEMPTIPKPLPPTSAHSPSIHRGPTNLSYQDILTGDNILSGSFDCEKLFGGMLWEVEFNFNFKRRRLDGKDNVDQVFKVTQIAETLGLMEISPVKQSAFLDLMRVYFMRMKHTLQQEKKDEFLIGMKNGVIDYLCSKLKDFRFFTGNSELGRFIRGSLVFSYIKDGASNPTFIYFAHSLKST